MSILPATMLLYLVAISTIFRSHSTAVPQDGQASPLSCNSCCQGQMGVAGVPGVPGVPGGNGPQGPAGPKGEIGQLGVATKGEKGDVGALGPRGEPGRGGAPGKVGPVGIQGPFGQDGIGGVPGRDGLDGSPGGRGQKGEIGAPRFSGFTVLKTSSQTDSGIVTFDTVITNAAGHYDINSNKFTCQIPGYYMFTLSIGFKDTHGPYVNLVKNEETIISAYGYPAEGTSTYRNMATNTALLLLASGDQVWLTKSYSGSGRQIYGDPTWKWTTFSGILLHET